MGTGCGCLRPGKHNAIQQLSTVHPLKEQPPAQQPKLPPSSSQKGPAPPPKTSEIIWPLPSDLIYDDFKPKWPSDLDRPLNSERYSLKRVLNFKSSLSSKKVKVTTEEEVSISDHHQKETSTNRFKHQISNIQNSAHVQSSLYSQSHACINLSSTEEINRLFVMLSEVHTQLDHEVEYQLNLISETVKDIIRIITNDTRIVQQQLLEFGKDKQMDQDTSYRTQLEMYISELDKWKSLQLAMLQDYMELYHKNIIDRSKTLISNVHKEANELKEKILRTSRQEANVKMQQLIERIQTISTHHLGTETMTKINLIIHGNVGNKMSDQCCNFNFDQSNNSVEEN